MDKLHLLVWVTGSAILFAAFYRWPGKELSHIPAVGFQSHFLSFLSSLEFYINAKSVVQRGCDKYPNGIFKIPTFGRWKVVVNSPKFVEEIRTASDKNVLSMHDSVDESLQVFYTLGEHIQKSSYHIPIIRTVFTRNLPNLFPEIYDEIVAAFSDVIPASNDWIKIKPMDIVLPIVARTSNRVFVGQPLCRNPEYLNVAIKYAIAVVSTSSILNLFPAFLRPLVNCMIRDVPASVDKALSHLKPIIEERLQSISEYGKDYPGKPDDMLSWLIDEAQGEERTLRNFASRILVAFTHVLFYLAAYPEFAEPMREELQEVLDREGWRYDALGQMMKIDSFIKETLRLTPSTCLNMERKCRKPFQFSDGTSIPKGTFVASALDTLHFDEKTYEDPHTFRPFRFANKATRENPGRKFDIVSIGTDFVPFGYGRTACPGRFFTSAELKTMLAYTLMTYDVKLENGISGRPKDVWFMASCLPNPKAHILLRKRA